MAFPISAKHSGTDNDNNGKVDNAADADGDGFADIVDQDANNDAIPDPVQKALLRTGADNNHDGRPDNYPYKNLDRDARPNLYDLDSDGDGIADVREAGFLIPITTVSPMARATPAPVGAPP